MVVFGTPNSILIERFDIQFPFLGGSFISGSTVSIAVLKFNLFGTAYIDIHFHNIPAMTTKSVPNTYKAYSTYTNLD